MSPHAMMNDCVIQFINFTNQEVIMKGCLISLKQVMMNLIKNALESMPNGGTVTIKLNINQESDAEIMIIDQGIGMSVESLENCISRFKRQNNKE